MRFVWDPKKAAGNVVKHGVSFEEAASVFFDPFAIDAADLDDPERTIVIGRSATSRVLFVVTIIFEADDIVRIISACKASAQQRRKYEETP